jgi:CBS domain-containing protein
MSCCSDVMDPVEASSCCTPQDTAADAARAMRDSGCGCAPVIESAESPKLVGVVTERDVCCGVVADDHPASDIRVEEIMKPASACCSPDQSLDEARTQLHEHRATSLPVVDKAGTCCGTVSSHSLERSSERPG